ncbi:general secretion pathway protein GspB [Massilia sp. GCM10023247]|uniref:general secretion pathway protein GspB n=1 Tax=Massilia sp. GCM10023247 TaxID=3252643 RepID=UPI003616E654
MSYILEALKKAQAERQLGHAPDIHTPAPAALPASAARTRRLPLWIGLGTGLLVAAVAGVLAWRSNAPAPAGTAPAVPAQADRGSPVAPPAPPLAAAPTAPAVVPDQPEAAPAAPPLARKKEPAAEPAPAVAKAAPPPRPAQPPRPAPPPRRAPAPAVAVAETPPQAVYLPAPAPAPARAAEPAPAARAPDPLAEESLRTLQQLPESVQREVPKVAVGGYIYSPNPADRLLLVDKMLRREGEELAPGLVLERLMPKYAVMNYRGTRYRVAY